MSKQKRVEMVKVPSSTLNAIKQMLFSNESGVDLSNIIADIKCGREDELTDINVALTYKGIIPDVGAKVRYDNDYNGYYEKAFLGVSLITDTVRYAYIYYIHKDDGSYERDYDGESTCSVGQWIDYAVSIDELDLGN